MQSSDWHLLFFFFIFVLQVPSFLFLFLSPQQQLLVSETHWTESVHLKQCLDGQVFFLVCIHQISTFESFLVSFHFNWCAGVDIFCFVSFNFLFLFYFNYSMPMMPFFISLPSWVTYDIQICNWHFIARQVPLPKKCLFSTVFFPINFAFSFFISFFCGCVLVFFLIWLCFCIFDLHFLPFFCFAAFTCSRLPALEFFVWIKVQKDIWR